MAVARINGVDLYYELHGRAGDWLIFVHGGGGTHMDWWRQIYAFRKHYRCVVYDSRGHGQSGGTEDYANGSADLLALMDHLKIDKAYLNGHSAGGWSVSPLTQQHPARVKGLVMTGSHFGFSTAALNAWAASMLEKFQAGYSVWDQMFSPKFAVRDPEMQFLQAALGRLNAGKIVAAEKQDPRRFDGAYIAMRDTPPVDYSAFPVRSLFIVGSDDALTTAKAIKGTAVAVAGSKYVEIPDAGHYVLAEQHEAYNAALLDFLRG
jgi:pimeloyl-ACP methyl ester carboxylesterase